jgi:hypothetical protein
MQNLKEKKNLSGIKRPKCPKPLEQKPSWMFPREEMHSWFTLSPHQMLNHIHVRFLLNTKNSKMCLKIKMLTPCACINHATAPLILKKECNLHSDPSITCNYLWIHQWKFQKWVHLTFQISNRCPYPFCQKKNGYLQIVSIIVDWINSPLRINTLCPWSKGCWTI